eukprot:2368012-Prymnesium_polylepis.1
MQRHSAGQSGRSARGCGRKPRAHGGASRIAAEGRSGSERKTAARSSLGGRLRSSRVAERGGLPLDQAVAVLVPVAEEVDDPHGVLVEHAPQLGLRRLRVVERHLHLDLRAERRALPAARSAAELVPLLDLDAERLAHLLVQLAIVDRTPAVLVEVVEDKINLAIIRREAQRAHRSAELYSINLPRFVRVPLGQQ